MEIWVDFLMQNNSFDVTDSVENGRSMTTHIELSEHATRVSTSHNYLRVFRDKSLVEGSYYESRS